MAANKKQQVNKVEEPVMDDPNAFDPNNNLEQDPAPVEKPAKEVKASSKFSDHLKAILEKHPHINNVWVNEKGEWHYGKKAGFVSYSREEILNG